MSVRDVVQAAAGALGGEALYVEDVFSTYLYTGNGGNQGITNGIKLGDFGVGTSTRFERNVDFLSRSSDLTGNADGKTFTFSCWVFLPPEVDSNQRMLYATDSSDNGFMVYVQSGNTLGLEAWNGGVRTLQAATSTVLPTNAWVNIIISLDTANSSNRYIYFNDVAASVTWSTYNNANIEFTRPTHYVGIWGNGTTRGFYDDMAHMYLDYTYRDLSTTSNRRIFIDANGGSTSTSTLSALNPILYLPLTEAYTIGENLGTGGDFTSSGSPTIVDSGTEWLSGYGQGGLVWTKSRSGAYSNGLYDTVRGATKELKTDATTAESTDNGVTAFNSDGYTVGARFTTNNSGDTYASWTFRKAPKFFDVVTYTGTGSDQNISHNLGVTPAFLLIKRTDTTSNWFVTARKSDNSYSIGLSINTTNSEVLAASLAYTENTSTTFAPHKVYDYTGSVNANVNGGTYVAYLFAHNDGDGDFGENADQDIIKCGSYTGTGSAGLAVTLGFEPQWLLIKNTGGGHSAIYDVMRQQYLAADLANAENQFWSYPSPPIMPNATGITIDDTNVTVNGSGNTYIYIAIRRGPMKTPESGTEVFAPATRTGNDTSSASTAGFPVDLGLTANRGAVAWKFAVADRLRGATFLRTAGTNAEGNPNSEYTASSFASNTQLTLNGSSDIVNANANTYIDLMFRRAPGFMDVVAYTGDGVAGRTVAHNLGVVPEMLIFKRRDATRNWAIVHANAVNRTVSQPPVLTGYDVSMNFAVTGGLGGVLNSTAPTSSVVTLSSSSDVNLSGGAYIAYLFATVLGVSKCGGYTGTGTTQTINCGFSAGARFVLIKRCDADGDWYVWDSARGIVAGNDPYLLLNSTAAEVTSTDYIDPYSAGFTVTSSAPAALNASGGTYIFLAIA